MLKMADSDNKVIIFLKDLLLLEKLWWVSRNSWIRRQYTCSAYWPTECLDQMGSTHALYLTGCGFTSH
jgi:hypothetical protein